MDLYTEEFSPYIWGFSYLTKLCYIILYAYWDSRWLFLTYKIHETTERQSLWNPFGFPINI